MTGHNDFFIEATTGYWQELPAEVPERYTSVPPYRYGYPVRLPTGRFLVLPLRRLHDPGHAVASLIANQASLTVVEALARSMAELASGFAAELVVGLPTLGLAFASLIAGRLGQPRYIPLGYSRKLWYDDSLAEPVSSITTPDGGKHLRLDPNLLPLVAGRRVVLVDDAISSGATAVSAVRLLRRAGAEIAGMVVAMKQTRRWQVPLGKLEIPLEVRSVFGCPQFILGEGGWLPVDGTQPDFP